MTASKTYPVPENILQSTHLTASQYDEMYKQSVEQPEAFWAEHASMLEWYQKPTKLKTQCLVKTMCLLSGLKMVS